MILTKKSFLLVALLGLAACNNPDRFGAGGGLGGAGGIDQSALGSASDPRSPAYFMQTVGDKVLFAVDQSTISPEARVTLAGQAQWLMANPQYTAIIEGHADEQGTREYNLALGERRAKAIANYLILQGIDRSRIESVSYGEERPAALGEDESSWARNRRVELR